jgi:hypothetical protein
MCGRCGENKKREMTTAWRGFRLRLSLLGKRLGLKKSFAKVNILIFLCAIYGKLYLKTGLSRFPRFHRDFHGKKNHLYR